MRNGTAAGLRPDRQRAIREIIAGMSIASQGQLAEQLGRRGYQVTQATVSRDIAELGLVKAARGERHVYVAPEDLAQSPRRSDDRLRRVLADIPVSIGRSGLILLVVATPGSASSIAQAIDESTLVEQEGTLAGDNTVLVLFADESRLVRCLERFESLQPAPAPSASGPSARPESPSEAQP